MTDWIGRTLSKVQIERLLGRGGMADVFLGRHTTLNRPVAIKVLHAHLSENDTLLSRFRAEAQAVAGLRHPYIVQVFDFDVTDDRPYIVMELLQGVSLKDYLSHIRSEGKQLSPETTARIISTLANALDYAHTRGIVHRDIKPANVMLRREGASIDLNMPLTADVEPILTDFGVARMADATVQTASGMIVGTPAYMSPEQVRGQLVDARSDIYSLGIMLYEMLSGVLPFDGDTQASVLIKHMTEPPPPLPHATPELQAVVSKALEKEPADRFQKASEMAMALEEALGLSLSSVATQRLPTVGRATPDPGAATQKVSAIDRSAPGMQTRPSSPGMPAVRQTSPLLWIVGGVVGVGVVVGVIALVVILGIFGPRLGAGIATQEPEPPEESTPDPGADEAEPSQEGEETAEGSSPTDEATTPVVDVDQPVGWMLLRDNAVIGSLANLPPPPEGMNYEAWLTEPDGNPLSLGVVTPVEGTVEIDFASPDVRNLVEQFSGFALTLEPTTVDAPGMSDQIVFAGTLSEESTARIRLMFSVDVGQPLQLAVLDGVTQQAVAHDSHLNYTLDAINANDLKMAKAHAEHVINITVGRESPEFGDYDVDGRVQNPGDGVGLVNYLVILQESLTALAAADPDSAVIAAPLLEDIAQQLTFIELAKNDEMSITAADAIEEVQAIGEDLAGLEVAAALDALATEAGALNLAIGIEIFPVEP